MRRLLPDTLAGRTFLVLLLGLVVSHAIGMAIYITDRATALNLAGGEHLAERMVTVARLVENAPREQRARLIALADDSRLRVTWTPESAFDDAPADDWEVDVLRRSFADHLAKLGERNFTLRYSDAAAAFEGKGVSESGAPSQPARLLRVSLQLNDGAWLNFQAPIEAPESIWSLRFVLSMAVMIATVVAVSALVINQIDRPLQMFARAARRFGVDVQAPHLPEIGSREVRAATRAFNEMQQRIRRLVEDRTRMLAAISHDLRTPITLLRLRAEFIADEAEKEKTLATLHEMDAMVGSILAFARDETASEASRAVDLPALVGSICDDMADAGLPVEFEGPERFTYPCRPSALKRALTNIIDNAVKYGRRAHVRLREEEKSVSVAVEDEGPGIPVDQMEQVFSPFYRIETSRSSETGGTGLGLSVAKAIVVAHGGAIELVNRPQGGLRATIKLPR